MPKARLAGKPQERLTDVEVNEIRSRRPAIRATLACEDLHLTHAEGNLLDQLADEHLTQDQRDKRVLEFLDNDPYEGA